MFGDKSSHLLQSEGKISAKSEGKISAKTATGKSH
jgi:hypothetical protein